MRVVGLDLSLTSTGLAVIEDEENEGGVASVPSVVRILSSGEAAASLPDRRARLLDVRQRILGLAWPADLVVVEGPSLAQRVQRGTFDRAGLWWLVVEGLAVTETPYVEVSPSARAKYATGSGAAGKAEVVAAVARRYPDVRLRSDDEADALVLAAMGARHLGRPIDSLPQVHLAAMSKVHWPTPPNGAS